MEKHLIYKSLQDVSRKKLAEREKETVEKGLFSESDSNLLRARMKQKYKKPGGTFLG